LKIYRETKKRSLKQKNCSIFCFLFPKFKFCILYQNPTIFLVFTVFGKIGGERFFQVETIYGSLFIWLVGPQIV
jgi:hypothetical protein